jgi:hypothetical protein
MSYSTIRQVYSKQLIIHFKITRRVWKFLTHGNDNIWGTGNANYPNLIIIYINL